MTHGTRIDIDSTKEVLTLWIREGHITPLTAFNRFWGYTFHLMQEDEKVTMSLFSGMRSFLLRKSAIRINNQEVLHYELETL